MSRKVVLSRPGRVLTRMERGELVVNTPQVNRQIYHLEGAVNRMTGAIVFAAFLLGGVFFYNAGDTTPAYVFWGFSAISLIRMAFLSRRSFPLEMILNFGLLLPLAVFFC